MARRRPRRKRKKKQVGFSGILLFLLVAVAATAGVYLASRYLSDGGEAVPKADEKGAPGAASSGRQPPRSPAGDARARRPAPPVQDEPGVTSPEPLSAQGARVAVVIDDLGRSLRDLDTLGRLDTPLTYSVLPFETRTADVVRELHRQGREILLHLPMEATNGANPGPGALELSMSDRALVRATRRALDAVPWAVGVNNHMGSRFSADPRAMRTVLGVLAEKGLFFLDSRTTPETVGFRLASELGMPAAERQVFLDQDPDPEAIRGEFHRLLALARERGSAIAIGHPHAETLEVLEAEVPKARELGYEFVPLSYLLQRSGELPE